MNSLENYYTMMKTDLSRSGALSRKMCLESLTGSDVQNNNLLRCLADRIGARKESVLNSAKRRVKMESDQTLIPIVTRMQRKKPEGDGYLTQEWILKAVQFYELDSTSDVLKGHCNVFKVSINNSEPFYSEL